MRIDNKQLKDFLLDGEILESSEIEAVFEESEKSGRLMGDLLLEKNLVSKDELNKLYAYILGTPFVDLSKETIAPEILKMIPEPIAKKYKIVAFDKSNGDLKVAMLNPGDLQTIEFIKKKTGLSVTPCLTTEEGISSILKQYEKSLKAEFGDMIGEEGAGITKGAVVEKSDKKSDKKLSKEAEDLPVINVVDAIIKHAVLDSASDIHIEPDEKEVRVRYRIGGILDGAMT